MSSTRGSSRAAHELKMAPVRSSQRRRRALTSWPDNKSGASRSSKRRGIIIITSHLTLLLLVDHYLPINQADGLTQPAHSSEHSSDFHQWRVSSSSSFPPLGGRHHLDRRAAQQRQTTGCDLLFASSSSSASTTSGDDTKGDSKLAQYCGCRDLAQHQEEENSASSSSNVVSQLDCRPDSLDQLLQDLELVPAAIQIDYLLIQTKLTTSARNEIAKRAKRFQVEQLSLTLEVGVENEKLDRQLVQLANMLEASQVQSLSLSLELAKNSRKSPGLSLNPFLAQFFALTRLQLMVGVQGRQQAPFEQAHEPRAALVLDADSLKQLDRLKWLSLASNEALELRHPNRLFDLLVNLEYLNLEASQLERFPLLTLFQRPANYHNLSSLNLAHNRLESLGAHLLCCQQTSTSDSGAFPALNQLDLSFNRLEGLSLREGQLLLRTMPHLVHLYLQHNKLLQVQLDSLLLAPLKPWPQSIFRSPDELPADQRALPASRDGAPLVSSLEFIDLSYNQLVSLSAFQSRSGDGPNVTGATSPRLKSINLSHNHLARPLDPLDARLINRLLFSETFDLEAGVAPPLVQLESHFELVPNPIGPSRSQSSAVSLSICNHLAMLVANQAPGDSLNELLLHYNQMEAIETHHFVGEHCASVDVLRLDHNLIARIEPGAFRWLVNLRALHLNDNQLTHLNDVSTFASAGDRLRALTLARNRLKQLNGRLFAHLTNLEELDLSENELDELLPGTFTNNSQLVKLNLSFNKLKHLDSSILNLKYLRQFELQGNQLRHFDLNLSKGSKLSEDYGENPALFRTRGPVKSTIMQDKQAFAGGHKRRKNHRGLRDKKAATKHRRWTTASLQEDEEPEFEPLSGRALVLTFNRMSSFESRWLRDGREQCDQTSRFGSNIQELMLASNELHEIAADTFDECLSNLRYLDLQANQVRTISPVAFQHLKLLQQLNLANNPIISLAAGTFAPTRLPYLKQLHLGDNVLLSTVKLLSIFNEQPLVVSSNETRSLQSLNLSNNRELRLDFSDLIKFIQFFAPSLRSLKCDGIAAISSSGTNDHKPSDRLEFNELTVDVREPLRSEVYEFLQVENVAIARLRLRQPQMGLPAFWALLTRKLIQNGLLELNLAGNQITSKQLMRLFEQLNSDGQTLADHLQLVHLDLGSNLLDRWPFDLSLSQKLEQLRVLNLTSNKLVDLPKSLKLPSLQVLDLSLNQLVWIPEQLFNDLGALESLDLTRNRLASVREFGALMSQSQRGLTLTLNQNENVNIESPDHGAKNRGRNEMLISEELLLTPGQEGSQLSCESVREFVNKQRFARHPADDQATSGQLDRDQEFENLHQVREHCQRLLDSLDVIKLAQTKLSTSSLKSLIAHIQGHRKPVQLDLSQNRLEMLTYTRGDAISPVVYLDLSENELTQADFLCADFANLKTLVMKANRLETFQANTLAHCGQLNYLDLSANKLKTFIASDIMSKLAVLKLRNNRLAHLDDKLATSFAHLRHLDLRSNLLTRPSQLINKWNMRLLASNRPKLDSVVIEADIPMIQERRLHLSIDDSSLRITSTSDHEQSMRISNLQNGQLVHSSPANATHVIKFCTLNRSLTHQVCLNASNFEESRCFLMRTPPKGATCLTNLPADSADDQSSTLMKRDQGDQQQQQQQQQQQSATSDIEEEQKQPSDPVLSSIESLKEAWLSLRQLDLASYLASMRHVRADSVLFKLWNGQSVHTLTLIKLGLVVAAGAVILLVVAMFALLTSTLATKGRQLRHKHAGEPRRRCNSDSPSPQLPTIATTLGTNDSSSTSYEHKHEGRKISASESSSSSGRPRTSQLLSANQLLRDQHLQASCSTPTSSIAQSGSFETVETMQAVDSLHSSNVHVSSLDGPQMELDGSADDHNQRTPTNPPDGGQQYYCPHHAQQLQHGAQMPVATVMRMVKSNSAQTFDRRASNRRTSGPFGYSTLARNPAQIYMPQFGSFVSSAGLAQAQTQRLMGAPDGDEEALDPATLSLLSINTQLSSHGYATAGALSPAQHPNQAGRCERPISLCQHHSARLPEQQTLENQVIFEQDELELSTAANTNQQSQQQQQQQQDFFLDSATLPPPPPISPSLYLYQGQ